MKSLAPLLLLLLMACISIGELQAQQLSDVRLSPILLMTPQPPVIAQSAARVGNRTLAAFTVARQNSAFSVVTGIAITLLHDSTPIRTRLIATDTSAIIGTVTVLGSSQRFYLLWDNRATRSIQMQVFDLEGEAIGTPVVAAKGTSLGSVENRWVIEGIDTTRLVVANSSTNGVPNYLIITLDGENRPLSLRSYAPGADLFDNMLELVALPGAYLLRKGDSEGVFIHADGAVDPRPISPILIQHSFVIGADTSLWRAAVEDTGDVGVNHVVLLHYPSLFDSTVVERIPVIDTIHDPDMSYVASLNILNRDSEGNWVLLVATLFPSNVDGFVYSISTEMITVDSLGHIRNRSDFYHFSTNHGLSTPSKDYGDFFGLDVSTIGYGVIQIEVQEKHTLYQNALMVQERSTTSTWLYDQHLHRLAAASTDVSGYYSTTEKKWISSTSSATTSYDPFLLDSSAVAEIGPSASPAMEVVPVTRATSSDSCIVTLTTTPATRFGIVRPKLLDTTAFQQPALALHGDTLTTLWRWRQGHVGRWISGASTPWKYKSSAPISYTVLPGGAAVATITPHAVPYVNDFTLELKVLTPQGMIVAFSTSSYQDKLVSLATRITRNPSTGQIAARYSTGPYRTVVEADSNGELVRTRLQSIDPSTIAYPIIIDTVRSISASGSSAVLIDRDKAIANVNFTDTRAKDTSTLLLPTADSSFLRLFPVNELENGRRRWHAELYRFDLSLIDSLSFFAPASNDVCSVVFHPSSHGIGLVWGSNNRGVRMTLLRSDLKVVAEDLQINSDTVTTSAPVAVFKGDTLFTIWEDRRDGTQQIYGGGMVLPGILRDSLISGRPAPADTVVVDPPDGTDPTDTISPPDEIDSSDTISPPAQILAGKGIALIPMPVQDRMTVIIDSISSGTVALRLYTIKGALAWSLDLTDQQVGRFEQTVDLGLLPRGVYRITVEHSGGVLTRTLVIDR